MAKGMVCFGGLVKRIWQAAGQSPYFVGLSTFRLFWFKNRKIGSWVAIDTAQFVLLGLAQFAGVVGRVQTPPSTFVCMWVCDPLYRLPRKYDLVFDWFVCMLCLVHFTLHFNHAFDLNRAGVLRRLDRSLGENGGDGTVSGITYFSCTPGHAVFVTRKKLTILS
jgi:hypothetical protein